MKKKEPVPIEMAYELLYQLGASATSVGFFQTAYAVKLAAEKPDRLLYVTKWLYPEVAKEYRSSWRCVERNIRSVIRTVWQVNPELLRKLAQYRIYSRPSASEFIAILSAHIYNQHAFGPGLYQP